MALTYACWGADGLMVGRGQNVCIDVNLCVLWRWGDGVSGGVRRGDGEWSRAVRLTEGCRSQTSTSSATPNYSLLSLRFSCDNDLVRVFILHVGIRSCCDSVSNQPILASLNWANPPQLLVWHVCLIPVYVSHQPKAELQQH